jgi:hypothetical protein
MRKSLSILSCAACFAALLSSSPAGIPYNAQDQVRISVLMISMPEEKFVALLPDLLDKDKIEKAVPELLDAVKRKEIALEGYPIVVTKSGQRAVTDTVTEFSDPHMDEVPRVPNISAPNMDPGSPDSYIPNTGPVSFESRNFGVTFEVEPVISQDGRYIDLNVAPQDVELLGYETFVVPKLKDVATGNDADPHQPIFFCMKTTTTLTLRSGQHMLLAAHKKASSEATVEIFIISAEILKVGSPDTAPPSVR